MEESGMGDERTPDDIPSLPPTIKGLKLSVSSYSNSGPLCLLVEVRVVLLCM